MAVDVDRLKILTQYKNDSADLQLFADEGDATVTALSTELSVLSQATRDRIALYLAAHYYILSYEGGGKSHIKTGESEEKYRTPAADKVGYLSTRFGQQAAAIDTTGTLTTISKPANGKVLLEVLKGD